VTGEAGAPSPGPLAGRRVLIARRWPELAAFLRAAGVAVTEAPVIEVRPPEDSAPLDRALGGLADYDWLVFTSASAVDACHARMETLGLALPDAVRIASVGPATTRAVRAAWPSARVAREPRDDDARAAGLVEAFEGQDVTGLAILLPVSDRAADVVERGLGSRGARVHRVVAYRTLTGGGDLARALEAGADAVVLASPSAVEAFLAATGPAGQRVPAAVIGPTTAEAARAGGMERVETAPAATVEGMMEALGRLLP